MPLPGILVSMVKAVVSFVELTCLTAAALDLLLFLCPFFPSLFVLVFLPVVHLHCLIGPVWLRG